MISLFSLKCAGLLIRTGNCDQIGVAMEFASPAWAGGKRLLHGRLMTPLKSLTEVRSARTCNERGCPSTAKPYITRRQNTAA